MGKIIAVVNQKGGVGKTTTSINLAASFAHMKRNVMLIDLDPQGNATVGSGLNKDVFVISAKQVLLNEAEIGTALIKTKSGYDILPTTHDLIVAEVQLMQALSREVRLKSVLATVVDQYDYIFIDCPPSLNILTLNALTAAHSLLIPIQCEYYALEGLTALLNTVQQVQTTINPTLHIEGLLRTMYDGRNRLALDVSRELIQHFPARVYRTVIPRNVRLAEAPSHGLSIMQYDGKSQGALAYLALANEMLSQTDEKTNENAKAILSE